MKKGIIYNIFNGFMEGFFYLNLVELFKYIAKKNCKNDEKAASRFAVDLFITFKWLVLFSFCLWDAQNAFFRFVAWYLIGTNFYTYFYYHVWSEDLAKTSFDLDRIKRRFLNLMLSVGFNIVSFAYLFVSPYSSNFKWVNGSPTFWDSFYFSLSTALTTSYEPVSVSTPFGHQLMIVETSISFIFLTIILSNSIPQTNTNN